MGLFIRKATGWSIKEVASWENLKLASNRASLGKRRRPDVEIWMRNEESELLKLRHDLLEGSYRPGGYRFFEITIPKRRTIAAAPFRDRVLHHALCRYMAPAIERRFIQRSFSCQKAKGTTAARDCCRRLVNTHNHALKCDIRKFFPSINHLVLRQKLDGISRCSRVLDLIDSIIESYATEADCNSPLSIEAPLSHPGRCGLPIGNLTSQMWGNLYLDGLDHWVTETKSHGAYLRYTDDFILFADDKNLLWDLRNGIVLELNKICLTLAEPKSRLLLTREGIPFCGFRFFPGLRPRILGATKRRFEKQRRLLAKQKRYASLTTKVYSWYQFSREANSIGLRKAYRSDSF